MKYGDLNNNKEFLHDADNNGYQVAFAKEDYEQAEEYVKSAIGVVSTVATDQRNLAKIQCQH